MGLELMAAVRHRMCRMLRHKKVCLVMSLPAPWLGHTLCRILEEGGSVNG